MTEQTERWQASRHIARQIVIEARLELLEPAWLGGGADPYSGDVALLVDELDGHAFLPGTSIAGALRSYWRQVRSKDKGETDKAKDEADNDAMLLFGGEQGDDDGPQSALIVDDAPALPDKTGFAKPQIDLREGVSIDPALRTAKADLLFDRGALATGTSFQLSFQLQLYQDHKDVLTTELARALQGFERGEIPIGARTRRGFGRCQVMGWNVTSYDLSNPQQLLAWLAVDRCPSGWPEPKLAPQTGPHVAPLLGVDEAQLQDQRTWFELEATLGLQGALLIRAGARLADRGVDAEHLQQVAWQADPTAKPETETKAEDETESSPIISGASLAGALRARAGRIVKALELPESLLNVLFGMASEDNRAKSCASRLSTREAKISGVTSLVQRRIKIDRFTGGTIDGALFEEAPVFGDQDSRVTLNVRIADPACAHIGLLLLLLKDLWLADLPLGGESGVGRGRLVGQSATLRRHTPDGECCWQIAATAQGLAVTGATEGSKTAAEALQSYVDVLLAYPGEGGHA